MFPCYFKCSEPRVFSRGALGWSAAPAVMLHGPPHSPGAGGQVLYLESAAAEPCGACRAGRALQGQYILNVPHCQLSPSQLRCRVPLQNLPEPSRLWPALPPGSLRFHTACALAFAACLSLHFNLSSPSPLPHVSPLCLSFYCDINLGNPNLWAKLPCPGGRPGQAWQRGGGSLGCCPPPGRSIGASRSCPLQQVGSSQPCSAHPPAPKGWRCSEAGAGRRTPEHPSLGEVAPNRGKSKRPIPAACAAGRAARHKAGG